VTRSARSSGQPVGVRRDGTEPLPVAAPRSDDEVERFWSELGLPGLFDVHVHFMPDNVMRKVWAYFDNVGPLTATQWPITYRGTSDQRLAQLRAMGVRRFPSLVYAHKPDMAEWLNGWAAEFAATHHDVIPTATMFPEPSCSSYVEAAIRGGARLFKVHVQVGGFDPRDPLLDAGWGMLAEAGIPVIVHAGSGPTPGNFTGPGPIAELLARHPTLPMIAAHMGMPEYDAFLDFAEGFDNVHVDTTMCFVDTFGDQEALGRELAPRLAALRDKVVLGADFPNIPHDYAHQLEVLERLDLGDDWLRAVCWGNPDRLIGAVGS